MSVIYGPDAFTVGTDTTLPAYNADWVAWVGESSAVWQIPAATDAVTMPVTTGVVCAYRYTGAGSPTGNQRISSMMAIAVAGGNENGFLCRAVAGGNAYIAVVTSTSMVVHRYDAGAYTVLAQATGLTIPTTPLACSFEAAGTGATVTLTLAVAGQSNLVIADTSGSRITNGVPGLRGYHDGGASPTHDDVAIDDLVSGGGPPAFDPTIHTRRRSSVLSL